MGKGLLGPITVLIVIVIAGFFLFYPVDNTITGFVISEDGYLDDNVSEETYEITDQFSHIAKLHWGHMPVTYNLVNPEVCSEYERKRIHKSFEQIGIETNRVVYFEQGNSSLADIHVSCFKGTRTVGYEPPYIVIYKEADTDYTTSGNEIVSADIRIFGGDSTTQRGICWRYPDLEIHEILHAFGYEHNDNRTSLMYSEYIRCNLKIDADIIQDLIQIYG